MKKALAMILLGVMSLSLLAGCGKKEETPAMSDTVQESSVSEPEEEPVSEPEEPAVPEGMARSYLTGEWIDEAIANQRPLAVMLGNTKIATPQYGITAVSYTHLLLMAQFIWAVEISGNSRYSGQVLRDFLAESGICLLYTSRCV